MALECDDVNARLLDLVYGEGEASERQALQAHVDGCARCRADLEALGRTRATVRARLDDAPPPGARARILEAAAQAIAGRSEPATATAGAAPAAAAARIAPTAPRRGGSSSLWAWLRGHWTLPTFATVGAVAVMLLGSKVLLNPKGAYDRGHEELFPAASAPPAPAPAPAHVAEGVPAPASLGSPAASAAPARDDKARRMREEARQFASPPVAAHAQAHTLSDNPLEGASEAMEAPPRSPPRRAVGGKRKAPADVALESPLDGLLAEKQPAAKPAPRAIAANDDRDAEKGYGAIGGVAGGGPAATGRARTAKPEAAAEPAPARVEAKAVAKAEKEKTREVAESTMRAEKKPAKRTVADDAFEGGVGSANARAAAAPPTPAAEAEASEEMEAPRAKDTRNYAQRPSGGAAAPSSPSPSMDELARRADRLFADGRWDEAAAAYQELLRRYPTADGAARWRARVTEARQARVAARAAKAPAPPAQPPAAAAPATAPTTTSAPAKR